MRLEVQPDRLTAASVNVRRLARALSLAGRDAAGALAEVGPAAPGSVTAAAALELAAEVAASFRTVSGGVDALAVALAAAASRYAEADILPDRP